MNKCGAREGAGACADDTQAGGIDVGGVVEKGGFLLHFLRSAEQLERVEEARDGHLLVVLVADHVLHALHLFQRLLHFLLALLAAHAD